MLNVLLVIHILITIALIVVILIQRNSSDGLSGLGGGSSSGNSLISGRASANLLTRITTLLAAAFMINCMVMATMVARANNSGSITEEIIKEETINTNEQPSSEDTTPSVPIVE